MGGAELVVRVLKEMFPDAPIYTSLYEPKNLCDDLSTGDVRCSFLQKLPKGLRKHQFLLPLMPFAFEQFDFSDYDLVISSSSACAKGIITGVDTRHICYCHTPMRYAWDFTHEYLGELHGVKKWVASYLMNRLRQWDRISADRVDMFVANSLIVQQRINKHYRRNAVIVYPPVDIDRFVPCEKRGDFFLVVSRLVSYKRIDLAVKACTKLGLKLIVIGDGEQRRELEKKAGPTVIFLGRQPDEVVVDYLGKAKAFLFPGYEDFGITMVEAQAAGCPVIAFAKGGAQDIVIDRETGILFQSQTVEALIDAIGTLDRYVFDPEKMRHNVQKFSVERFKLTIEDVIKRNSAN
jgi:glycosyltransferase involved in cell wall biosynthesis